MTYQVLDGRGMDAHIDLDPLGIVLHSRGGNRGRGDADRAKAEFQRSWIAWTKQRDS